MASATTLTWKGVTFKIIRVDTDQGITYASPVGCSAEFPFLMSNLAEPQLVPIDDLRVHTAKPHEICVTLYRRVKYFIPSAPLITPELGHPHAKTKVDSFDAICCELLVEAIARGRPITRPPAVKKWRRFFETSSADMVYGILLGYTMAMETDKPLTAAVERMKTYRQPNPWADRIVQRASNRQQGFLESKDVEPSFPLHRPGEIGTTLEEPIRPRPHKAQRVVNDNSWSGWYPPPHLS